MQPPARPRSSPVLASRGTAGGSPRPEASGGGDLGDYPPLPLALARVARGHGRLLLRLIVYEHSGAVLAADVPALAVASGGIVALPERVEQLLVGDRVRVILHLDGLGMASAAAADPLVRRILDLAARVTHGRTGHARQCAESGLDSPETSGGKGCGLGRHRSS